MHHLERYTSPEWPARASHNRRSAPHAFGPRKRPGNSLHSKCARNGTSNSGRNPRARHRPLAHQNAPSRALHGLGVARPHPQPRKRSTCVLPTRSKASWDSFARKRCSQRQHLLDNARNSRGRATDRSPIQMRYLVRYTGPEWRAHAHNRRNATRACSQHAETHHGIPLHSNGVCSKHALSWPRAAKSRTTRLRQSAREHQSAPPSDCAWSLLCPPTAPPG